jgi:hypothetical protein
METKFKVARGNITGHLLSWAAMKRPPWRRGFVLIALILAAFALSPQAQAVCQQGCLTNDNTVLGDDALLNNIGSANTATGFQALFSNTTGIENTAVGWRALQGNTIGNANTAVGTNALQGGGTGGGNTVLGESALGNWITASRNTAVGLEALLNFSSGNSNIAVGDSAGANLTTGDNNIDIGNEGVAGESDTIRIGTQGTQTKTFIAGIAGAAIIGRPVMINGNGRLGTPPSSGRFKEEIKPMDKASEAILGLKPVTFRYKKEVDADRTPEFGLVAEDVEKVNPDLVVPDADGKPYTVRYEAVNAMLLNEFLKEHRKVQEQEATIAALKSIAAKQEMINARQQREVKALAATLREQTSQIQKVSARLELGKAPAQTVVNNQ